MKLTFVHTLSAHQGQAPASSKNIHYQRCSVSQPKTQIITSCLNNAMHTAFANKSISQRNVKPFLSHTPLLNITSNQFPTFPFFRAHFSPVYNPH